MDRSTVLEAVGPCELCGASDRRPRLYPQSDSGDALRIGDIHKLHSSIFAPLVQRLQSQLSDLGKPDPRPAVLSSLELVDKYEVYLMATLHDRHKKPGYPSLPGLFKSFVLRVAQTIGKYLAFCRGTKKH